MKVKIVKKRILCCMVESENLDFYKRRAVFLSHRSLLELEVVLMEALRKELPERVTTNDGDWLKELVQVLELDDYALLDAILGNIQLDDGFDPKIIDLLQSYLPSRIN